LGRDPKNPAARLQLGYIQLTRSDPSCVSSLESVVSGPSVVSRSILGSAKVYLALALDAHGNQRDARSDQRVDQLLKEGLVQHRNLQHVWQEIEMGLASQPVAAVQRLRGICDLDLTTLQAQQLLRLLAQAFCRADLARAAGGGGSEYGRSRAGSAEGSRSRAPSQAVARWAPSGPAAAVPQPLARGRSSSPGAQRGSFQIAQPSLGSFDHQRAMSVVPRCGSAQTTSGTSVYGGRPFSPAPPNLDYHSYGASVSRGRSMSPGPALQYNGGSPGSALQYNGGGSSLGAPASPMGAGSRFAGKLPRDSSRDYAREHYGGGSGMASPQPNRGATTLELGWHEVIRPEELVFGPCLGSGGSGQVFRGSLRGREVAIKKIAGATYLEELKKEVEALRKLRHPRLVTFIGACLQPSLLLIVTEFMSGGSLHERLFGVRSQPPMNPKQRHTVGCQMVEGVSFLHEHRLVHRDMKSMNILLDHAHNAKLCDFGLAQQMDATHIARKTSGEGGSPRYMAPECYDAAHGKLTEKVDVWAVGCIMIEIFGNFIPYADCGTMPQLTKRLLIDRRPPDIPNNVPASIGNLIRRCLVFDQYGRISASDLLAELTRIPER